MNLYFWRIRKVKGEWEVKRTGKNWHVHLGKGLFKQIKRCFKFKNKKFDDKYLKLSITHKDKLMWNRESFGINDKFDFKIFVDPEGKTFLYIENHETPLLLEKDSITDITLKME